MATVKKKTKQKRMNPDDYIQAKEMWASGQYFLKDIGKKFDISVTALVKRFKKDDVKKGQDKDKHQKAISESLAETHFASAPIQAKVIAEEQEMYTKTMKFLHRQQMVLIRKSVENGVPFGAIKDDINTLILAQKGCAICYEAFATVHRIDELKKADDLPSVLKIQTMSDVYIENMKNAQVKQAADLASEGDFEEIEE